MEKWCNQFHSWLKHINENYSIQQHPDVFYHVFEQIDYLLWNREDYISQEFCIDDFQNKSISFVSMKLTDIVWGIDIYQGLYVNSYKSEPYEHIMHLLNTVFILEMTRSMRKQGEFMQKHMNCLSDVPFPYAKISTQNMQKELCQMNNEHKRYEHELETQIMKLIYRDDKVIQNMKGCVLPT